MIITQEKPLEEILKSLPPYKKILIVGCQGCFQPPRGMKEAQAYLPKLEEEGYNCRAVTVARQCDNNIVATKLKPQLEDAEAILSLGCGVGVQTLAEIFPKLPVFPAQNTVFIGAEGWEGSLHERCSACGDCILDKTGGICPITRCAKSLLNGPCGGSQGGKCEVDPQIDCAWQLIYDRLRALDKLELLTEIQPPKDWSTARDGGPRFILQKEEGSKSFT